jgi:hypothetical protein
MRQIAEFSYLVKGSRLPLQHREFKTMMLKMKMGEATYSRHASNLSEPTLKIWRNILVFASILASKSHPQLHLQNGSNYFLRFECMYPAVVATINTPSAEKRGRCGM